MTTAQLSDFCKLVQGGRHKLSGKHFVAEGYPAYGAGGLNGYLPTAEFDQDAIVLSAIGARCGKCFLAEGEWSSLAYTQVILPDERKADIRFLWYQLNDEGRWPRHGLAQPFIRPSDVKAHTVYLPPLDEQRRITGILNEADALRRKRKRALDLLDGLTQSIFLEMFGDPVRNPYRFSEKKLGEVARFYSGNSLPAGKAFAGQREGYLLIKVSDLGLEGNNPTVVSATSWNELPGTYAGTCPAGAIVFTKRGGAIATNKKRKLGRAAVLDPNLMAVLPSPQILSTEYLYAWFQRFRLEDISSGSSVPQLNKRDLEPLPICVPPMKLQEEFAARCRRVSSVMSRMMEASSSITTFFASLQSRAFSGQL